MAIKNKRSNPRYDSLNLLAYSVFNPDETMKRQGMGRTLNVSESGILLETHLPVEAGLVVSLNIGLENELVDILGKAVYSRKGNSDRYETGINFMEMDADQKERLDKFILAFEKMQSA